MNFPQTVSEIGFVLILVVPGIVYTAVRRKLRGPTPEDQDFSVRLVNAIAASVVYASSYLIIFGPTVASRIKDAEKANQSLADWVERSPREFGVIILTFAIAIPVAVALIVHFRIPQWEWLQWNWAKYCVVHLAWLRDEVSKARVASPPSAWDEVAPKRANCFVRVWTNDGFWVGGIIGDSVDDSGYVATYPHPRDMFIPEQWRMADDGSFIERMTGTQGVYVPLGQGERVEWIDFPDDDEPDQPQPPQPVPRAPLRPAAAGLIGAATGFALGRTVHSPVLQRLLSARLATATRRWFHVRSR